MNYIKKHADIVSLNLPLNSSTKNLFNNSFINSFSKPIWIINTSRGEIVNTVDLVKNLKSKKLNGACLDVLEFETSSFEMINHQSNLLNFLSNSHNVILSPHIAGWTLESKLRLSRIIVEKILNFKNSL